MNGTVLVTGATGRVGGHVVAELGRRGTAVRALTRDPAAELVATLTSRARKVVYSTPSRGSSAARRCRSPRGPATTRTTSAR